MLIRFFIFSPVGALKDLSKAKYWIKKAYEGGNARAKEALGAFKLWKH
jgi:TPR repeat protein